MVHIEDVGRASKSLLTFFLGLEIAKDFQFTASALGNNNKIINNNNFYITIINRARLSL